MKIRTKYCLITNDVETTSLRNHCLSDKAGEKVLKEGIPLLLETYSAFNIKATFFFTGYIAQKFPDVVRMILPYGHEVGCHGLTHDSTKAFDLLNYEEQIVHLQKAKDILEKISSKKVISFRAPALRVNSHTPQALEKTGFKIDSSIAPQRFDMFFSLGSMKKLKWLTAPRKAYFTKVNDLAKSGNGLVFEVPISSFLFPYIGTFMRISPSFTKVIRSLLNIELHFFNHPLNFLIHPNELIEEEAEKPKLRKRSNNYFSYLLADKLRYYLKLKNLGKKVVPLLNDQLFYLSNKSYKFVTLCEYYNIINTND